MACEQIYLRTNRHPDRYRVLIFKKEPQYRIGADKAYLDLFSAYACVPTCVYSWTNNKEQLQAEMGGRSKLHARLLLGREEEIELNTANTCISTHTYSLHACTGTRIE